VATAVLEVRVPDAERARASEILASIAGEAPKSDISGTALRVPARDGIGTLVAAVRAMDEAGLTPEDVALQRPTLDDVFLALTGGPPRTQADVASRRGRRGRRDAELVS